MPANNNDFPDLERQFGTDPGNGEFNAITKEYKANPTIENYLRLRRQFPDKEIEVATTGGFEFLFAEHKNLRQIGIDPDVVAQSLDADIDAQAELSLRLMELLIERRQLQAGGESHIVSRSKGVSDTTINYLIAGMLDSISWNDKTDISRELIVLIKHQLNAFASKFEAEEELREKKYAARIAAYRLIAAGKKPTLRQIAKSVGVNASTVMRWFQEGDFGPKLLKLYEEIMELRKREANGG